MSVYLYVFDLVENREGQLRLEPIGWWVSQEGEQRGLIGTQRVLMCRLSCLLLEGPVQHALGAEAAHGVWHGHICCIHEARDRCAVDVCASALLSSFGRRALNSAGLAVGPQNDAIDEV